MRLTVLFTAILLVMAFTTSTRDNRIIGTWYIQNALDDGQFEFYSDGFVNLLLEGDTIKGRGYKINKEEYFMRYRTDTSKSPHRIKLMSFNKTTKTKVLEAHGVYEFLSKDKLKMYINFEDFTVPTTFDQMDTDTFTRLR